MIVSQMIEWLKTQRQDAIVRIVRVDGSYSSPSETTWGMVDFEKHMAYTTYTDANKSICILDLGSE